MEIDSIQTNDIQIGDTSIQNFSSLLTNNYIINGNFDIWQRGTSQTSTGYGSDDRWWNVNGTSTKTHSRQEFTVGQTDVPGNPKYFSRTVVVTGGTTTSNVQKIQKIENVKTLAGKTVTLSFYAKADSSKNIAVEFYQHFGNGGTPSANIQEIGVTTCPLTTAWQKFAVVVDIPSISGKTIGTLGNDWVGPIFWFDSGSTYNARNNSLGNQSGTFDIAQVKLEEGSSTTPFIARPIAQELALCQRYYWRGGPPASIARYYNMAGTYRKGGQFTFPVRLRSQPTVSIITEPTYGNCSNLSIIGTDDLLLLRVTVTSTGDYYIYGGVYDADADL